MLAELPYEGERRQRRCTRWLLSGGQWVLHFLRAVGEVQLWVGGRVYRELLPPAAPASRRQPSSSHRPRLQDRIRVGKATREWRNHAMILHMADTYILDHGHTCWKPDGCA